MSYTGSFVSKEEPMPIDRMISKHTVFKPEENETRSLFHWNCDFADTYNKPHAGKKFFFNSISNKLLQTLCLLPFRPIFTSSLPVFWLVGLSLSKQFSKLLTIETVQSQHPYLGAKGIFFQGPRERRAGERSKAPRTARGVVLDLGNDHELTQELVYCGGNQA